MYAVLAKFNGSHATHEDERCSENLLQLHQIKM